MPSLHDIQKNFISTFDNNRTDFYQSIRHNKSLTAEEQFSIYANSIIGALQKALKEIFPVCYKLLGHDFFIHMINTFISQTHSTSPDIGECGLHFSDFIEAYEPANTLPYLADVARLEWAWHKIYFAPDNIKFDYQKLTEVYTSAGNQLIFTLPTDSFLLTSPYPIHQIWETNQPNYIGEQKITLSENEKYYFLVWRKLLELRIDPLTYSEWQILSWMQNESTLEQVCENISQSKLDIDMVSLLPQLINLGWIADFKI